MRFVILSFAVAFLAISTGSVLAGVVEGGAKTSSKAARDLFTQICVQQDARGNGPVQVAKALGFKKGANGAYTHTERNVDVVLLNLNGVGICALHFLPSNNDSTLVRDLGRIPGMKKGRGGGYVYNGNGQRSASVSRASASYPKAVRVFEMTVGKNADKYDK